MASVHVREGAAVLQSSWVYILLLLGAVTVYGLACDFVFMTISFPESLGLLQ